MRVMDWNNFKSLEDILGSLNNFLNDEYRNKVHSITNKTPNNSWHEDIEKIIFKEHKEIDIIFLSQTQRKVRKDRTVHLNKNIYEVPFRYVGKKIIIKYNLNDLNYVWVYENLELKDKCCLINKIDNAKIKRKNNINYTKVINNEEDVLNWEEN
jgi:hypothetical protein